MNNDLKIIQNKLLKCVNFENIEDKSFIVKTLDNISTIIKALPLEIQPDIEVFITEHIHPIVYDDNYFDFLHKKEFGSFKNGSFNINSEKSLDRMIVLLNKKAIDLENIINNFFLSFEKSIVLN
mgnify:FL=1